MPSPKKLLGCYKVDDRLHRVEIAYRPIRCVNVLVYRDKDGLVLIDSGPPGDHELEALEAGIAQTNSGTLRDVHTVLITHSHTDHFGQAGNLQDISGCDVFISSEATGFFEQRYHSRQNGVLMDWLIRNGLPTEGTNDIADTLPGRPRTPTQMTDYGDSVQIDGNAVQVVPTSGHAPGHVAFYDPRQSRLFSGDSVLEDIIPFVDVQPFRGDDTMAAYLDGLLQLLQLDFATIIPAHGRPFRTGHDRIRHIVDRHLARIGRVRAVLLGSWVTAYDVYQIGWKSRAGQDLIRLRMTLTQILGYLGYLQHSGVARCEDRDGIVYWTVPMASRGI